MLGMSADWRIPGFHDWPHRSGTNSVKERHGMYAHKFSNHQVRVTKNESSNLQMNYIFNVWILWSIAAQTRLIKFKGFEDISTLAGCTDIEIDAFAHKNRNVAFMVGSPCTKNISAAIYWVRKSMRGFNMIFATMTVPPNLIYTLTAAHRNGKLQIFS